MDEYLNIPKRYKNSVRGGETAARAITGNRSEPWGSEGQYQWWIEHFGLSREEMDEMIDALIRAYKNTPRWKVGKRKALMKQIARWKGTRTAAMGLRTEWC